MTASRGPVAVGSLQSDSARRSGTRYRVPSSVLERVVLAAGLEVDPFAARRASDGVEDDCDSWQEALASAAMAHGLRIRTTWLSPREIISVAQTRLPLVRCCERTSAEPEWITALGSARGRVRISAPDQSDVWLNPADLAARLGVGDAVSVLPWALVEPRFPATESGTRTRGEPASEKLDPLLRLRALVRPDRSDLWAILLFAAFVGGLTLATPIAVQLLVNTVAFGGLLQPVLMLAVLLFGGLTFGALLFGMQAYVAERIQRRVFVRVTADLAERLPRVRTDVFDHQHGPELVNRFFDVVTVQKVGALLLVDGTAVLLQTLVGVGVLSLYHPLMLAFSVLLVGGIAFVTLVLGRGAVYSAIRESKAKYAVAGWMEELARHPATFRSVAGRRFALARADELASDYVAARENHYQIVLRQLSGALGLQVLASSSLLLIGGSLVVSGQLTLGQLVAAELIVTAIVAAFAKLGKQLESFYDLLAAVDKLGDLFDLPLERESGSRTDRQEGAAALEVRDLSLSYGSRPVLSGVSVRVEPADRVAIVGPPGCGKSTLVDVVAGLREPTSGHVRLDGRDLRDLRLDSLREQVVLVRDPEIFVGTVTENVRMGRESVSNADVDEALSRVGLLEEVRSLPRGKRTLLATDGAPLSHSQAARLMLARAILGTPRLLLLDHAFVTLDEKSRQSVLDTLVDERAPWTLLVVSEWADVIGRCRRIVNLAEIRQGLSENPTVAPGVVGLES